MHPVIRKTLWGLSPAYYRRQLFFGCIFLGIYLLATLNSSAATVGGWLWALANTLLYPYSRFVYEGVVGYIVGKNFFMVSAVLFLGFKIVTMIVCWCLALIVAPVGLAYLYFYHNGKLS